MALSMGEQLRNQMSGTYLPRLVAVAYAVFDPTQGPKIVHQIPEGVIATALNAFPTRDTAISPTTNPVPLPNEAAGLDAGGGGGVVKVTSGQGASGTQVLFDFSSVLEFVIPKPELCGNLITKATRTSKILGFPVRIFDEEKYHKGREVYNRNAFIFNLCFVFERDAELSGFEPLVRKTARTLRMLEESVSLLSDPPSTFNMSDLLEQLFMDINSFSETSISIKNDITMAGGREGGGGAGEGIDLKLDLMLFPFYANPREINTWDVPIAVTPLETMKNGSWDVTLYKVCAFIDGVNPVRRIAELAEVDQNLGRLCIQHLLFYSAILLVDLFQFSNCYTTLPGIADIAQFGESEDDGVTDLRAECEAYIYAGIGDTTPAPFPTILSLYSKLTPEITVSRWMDDNDINPDLIDVRRMIQFGIIKGFLRRVYSYPIWLDHPVFLSSYTTSGDFGVAGKGKSGGGKGKQSRYKTLHRENTSSTIDSVTTPTGSDRPHLDRNVSSTSSYAPYPTPLATPTSPLDPDISPSQPIPRESNTSKTYFPRTNSSSASALLQPKSATPSTNTKLLLANTFPDSLRDMCDGTHHTDEICVRYGMSLRQLEGALRIIGGATTVAGGGGGGGERIEGGKRGDYGSRVVIIQI